MSSAAISVPGTGVRARIHDVHLVGARGASPVVLAHGFGCDQTMWRRMLPAFQDRFEVVLFDHVGAGASDLDAFDPRRYRSLQGYADDLVQLLDELALGPVSYVGHSVGAMIGLLASVARPDLFSSLVMVGASPRYLDDDPYVGGFTREGVDQLLAAMDNNYLSWARDLAPAVMGNSDRPQLAAELEQSFARTQSAIAIEFARATFLSDHRADLARVTVPTLVVQTAEDPMVPASVAPFLQQGIAGSQLAELAATGHFPHVSGPEETARVVCQFIDDAA